MSNASVAYCEYLGMETRARACAQKFADLERETCSKVYRASHTQAFNARRESIKPLVYIFFRAGAQLARLQPQTHGIHLAATRASAIHKRRLLDFNLNLFSESLTKPTRIFTFSLSASIRNWIIHRAREYKTTARGSTTSLIHS